jgi:hypothetical protein
MAKPPLPKAGQQHPPSLGLLAHGGVSRGVGGDLGRDAGDPEMVGTALSDLIAARAPAVAGVLRLSDTTAGLAATALGACRTPADPAQRNDAAVKASSITASAGG